VGALIHRSSRKRGLCCVDKETFEAQDFDSHWNSLQMKEIRKNMMSGIAPERCAGCFGKDVNTENTYRQSMIATYAKILPKIFSSTNSEGETTLRPRSFDHRKNTCNFKCRTCGPYFSTSIHNEALQSPLLAKAVDYRQASHSTKTAKSGSREEMLKAARANEIEKIYWAGGEPLLNPVHWEVMNELVSIGYAPEVEIVYNTNLSSLFLSRDWPELLRPFKAVEVLVSCDGLGQVGEYIRTGFKAEQFLKNLNDFRELTKNHDNLKITLDLTLTSLNLLYLGDVLEFVKDSSFGLVSKLMLYGPHNSYLATEFLPRERRDFWIQKWLDWIETNSPKKMDNMAHVLRMARARPTFSEVTSHKDFYKLCVRQAKTVEILEQARPGSTTIENLLSLDPEILTFWNSVTEKGRGFSLLPVSP
jgi:sulfatase maturation enzyme AslB (radical SAM superfamily)